MNRAVGLKQLATIFARAVPDSPDWTAIVALANEQLITPELADRLEQLGAFSTLPEELRDFLEDVRHRTRERNARLRGTLDDALGALNAAGIKPALLKGCCVWAGQMPDRNRIVSDIDLLVRAGETATAIESLAQAGFTIVEDGRREGFHQAVVLQRTRDVGTIDLHQHAPGPANLSAAFDSHQDSQTVSFRGRTALLPSPEAQILITVLHDQFQDGRFWRGGFDLRHLLDIAALAESDTSVDWQRLIALCPTPTIRLAMQSQLLAAKRMVAADIPDRFAAGFWGGLHYRRQRMQYIWPALNAPFHKMGLNKNVWMSLSSRMKGRRPKAVID